MRAVLAQIPQLWADVTAGRSSPEAFAAIFTPDASFVVGDGTYLRGRGEIAAYYQRMIEGSDGFGFTIKGTTVTAEADDVRFLGADVAIITSHGGILFPGETVVPPERRGIQTSVVHKVAGAWLVSAYQNTRIHQYPAATA